jgi:hypothetical protein
MTKKVYYIKEGRKYIPVAEYDSDLMMSFPKGTHIVMCYPGGQSTRYGIDPAYAPMIAAGRLAEDVIRTAIHLQSEAKPKEYPITERQRAAWQEMKAAFGDEFFSLQFASTHDLAEAGVNAMVEEAEKLMKTPSVKEAYDHFMFLAKLAYDENKNSSENQ